MLAAPARRVVVRFLQHPSMHGRTIRLQRQLQSGAWEDFATTVVPNNANARHAVATFLLPTPVMTDRIRVVNLSLNSTVEQSYNVSPLSAAAEILWFNGVVVVASAGNVTAESGYNTINAGPANDPFLITVGASNENGTSNRADDNVALFSAYGTTMNGFRKPDIDRPGQEYRLDAGGKFLVAQ